MENENLVVISRSNLRTVSFGIALPIGSAIEPIPGVTDVLITHMLRNTMKYNENEFADIIDKYGIGIFSDVDRTSTILGFRVPPQHLKKSLEIFNEILTEPNFSEDTIQKIVQQQIGGLQQIKSTPEAMVSNYTKWTSSFGTDPITKHPAGSIEGLQKLNTSDLENWHKAILRYNPYFASVGKDISEIKFKEHGLENILSIFGGNAGDYNPISNSSNDLSSNYDEPEVPSSNAYIGINIRGSDPSLNNYGEDLYRAIISGGMSARMFTKIREEKNLSYAPRMSVERFTKGSLLTALMDVSPDRAVEALETTVNLLHEAIIYPVDKDEMNRALKGAQRIAVFVSDSSVSYTNFILDRLITNREYDLNAIKNQLTKTSEQDWQDQVQELWTKRNISFAVSGQAGDVMNKWEEIMEKMF
ncbi:MAG: hypothetical protein HeimC2_23760 [Candidatus Heimdallarchaeota archaeon LC_2]|nr:MAG: hypothetical protein HeimC2_23760 [Candidatus Heimdallarchaeota archaeon LC_2]